MILVAIYLDRGNSGTECNLAATAAEMGISPRTAYRALREIRNCPRLEINARPGRGVKVSFSGLLVDEHCVAEGEEPVSP